MNILLAEDHSIVRYAVINILQNILPQASIDESGDFDDTLKQISKKKYDLLILDINIPNGNNLEMISLLRLRQPDIKILIFTGADEKVFAIRYLREGADGYLMKDAPHQEIQEAVQCVLNNERYVSVPIRKQLLKNLGKEENILSSLSDREIEVMQLLIQGLTTGEIAKNMNLHISTVSTYKTRIFQKLEVSNVIDLAEKRKLL